MVAVLLDAFVANVERAKNKKEAQDAVAAEKRRITGAHLVHASTRANDDRARSLSLHRLLHLDSFEVGISNPVERLVRFNKPLT